jgi:hypothetical protein
MPVPLTPVLRAESFNINDNLLLYNYMLRNIYHLGNSAVAKHRLFWELILNLCLRYHISTIEHCIVLYGVSIVVI